MIKKINIFLAIVFAALFGLKGLRLSYNDYQKCATKVKRKTEIDDLFR